MIGPGGLLLVVPHLFAVPVYGGVEKNRLLKLNVKNNFVGSHTEHRCR